MEKTCRPPHALSRWKKDLTSTTSPSATLSAEYSPANIYELFLIFAEVGDTILTSLVRELLPSQSTRNQPHGNLEEQSQDDQAFQRSIGPTSRGTSCPVSRWFVFAHPILGCSIQPRVQRPEQDCCCEILPYVGIDGSNCTSLERGEMIWQLYCHRV